METKIYRVGAYDVARIEKLLIQFALIGVGIGVVISIIITGTIFSIAYHQQKTYYEDQIETYSAKLTTLVVDYEGQLDTADQVLRDTVTTYDDKYATYTDQIDALNFQIADLEAEILRLSSAQTADFEMLKNYLYIFTDSPTNSGLTIDHIKWSWECAKTWNVNPQLMWAIYEVESDLNPKTDNAKSSARGLGQVLESTAKEIWEDVLGHGPGSYKHTMAYDPYVNIEITTCLLGRNLANGTMEDAIWLYGDRTESYYGKVINAATDHGYTLTENNAHYMGV